MPALFSGLPLDRVQDDVQLQAHLCHGGPLHGALPPARFGQLDELHGKDNLESVGLRDPTAMRYAERDTSTGAITVEGRSGVSWPAALTVGAVSRCHAASRLTWGSWVRWGLIWLSGGNSRRSPRVTFCSTT